MRKPSVTKEEFKQALKEVERQALDSRKELWQALARTEMAKRAGWSVNTLKAKARQWRIVPETPARHGRRKPGLRINKLMKRPEFKKAVMAVLASRPIPPLGP
jgi:hypothetical protein